MLTILLLVSLLFTASGCADIPIKDGELAIGKNTTAGVEDIGEVKITNQF